MNEVSSFNQLLIYRSSAGSGKTYTLVLQYLMLALRQPAAYKQLLAITFTNKATTEMKQRILTALQELASGNTAHGMLAQLQLALPTVNVPQAARNLLGNILHGYNHFAIATMESFFYELVKSFAYELRLNLAAELELDEKDALQYVTDALLADLALDAELRAWIEELLNEKLDSTGSWNVRKDLSAMAEELFSEQFTSVFKDDAPAPPQHIRPLIVQLRMLQQQYANNLQALGQGALQTIQRHGLQVDDFAYGKAGVAGYLHAIAQGQDKSPGNRVEEAATNPAIWTTKGSSKRGQIEAAVQAGGLQSQVQELLQFRQQQGARAAAATAVLKRAYLYPLLGRLQAKLTAYRDEQRVMLISDVGRLLASLVGENEVPFIYEKAGNHYQHLLIDEFQDTSQLQWLNLLPLVNNTLASGNHALVVGDVKQAIYRFRQGNLGLLLQLPQQFAHVQQLVQTRQLNQNRRSGQHIVAFNNSFFATAAQLVAGRLGDIAGPAAAERLNEVYGQGALVQSFTPAKVNQGYVAIEFLPNPDKALGISWKEAALQRLLTLLNKLKAQGFSWRHIALLVRKNPEGSQLAEFLLGQGYPVISAELLQVGSSSTVQVLISALQFLWDPQQALPAAHLAKALPHHPQGDVPALLLSQRQALLLLPLQELAEQVWRMLFPAQQKDAFVARFQDAVIESLQHTPGNLPGFLQWWQAKGERLSIQASEDEDAIRITTVHKAKGLQYPIVIMPFAQWDFNPRADTLLWAEAQQEPFAGYGPVPIGAQSKWETSSPFHAHYAEEYTAAHIDALNLLYVAFTRAEQRLYVFMPQPPAVGKKEEEDKTQLTTAKLVYQALQGDAALAAQLVQGRFTLGQELSATTQLGSTQPLQASPQSVAAQAYPLLSWREKISFSSQAGQLQTPAEQAAPWVFQLRSVLTQAVTAQHAQQLLTRLLAQGDIAVQDAATSRDALQAVLALPQVQAWFQAGWQLHANPSLWLKDGRQLRPQRLMLCAGQASVVRITVQPTPADQRLLSWQQRVVASLGYNPVQAGTLDLQSLGWQGLPALQR